MTLGRLDDFHDLLVRVGLQCDEHYFDAISSDDRSQISDLTEHRQAFHLVPLLLALSPHKTHNLIALCRRRAQILQKPGSTRIHPHNRSAAATDSPQQELKLKTAHDYPPTCN